MPIPIIMKIGSAMGPGGLASLQAGLSMIGALGRKVAETIKELDRFAQAARKLAGPIDEADSKTHGLIDTMALMVQRNKIAEAGLKLTGKQYRVVAVAAVKMAQATGQDATAAFERLTKSILMGSSRSLKEFGIDLEETEDQVLAQKEAIEKLTEKYGETTVAIETVSEGVYALGNNLETAAGLAWKKYASGAENALFWLDLLNDGLVDFNSVLDHNDTALSANIRQQERWAESMKGNVADTFFWLVSQLEDDWFFSDVGEWAKNIRKGAYASQKPSGERFVSEDDKEYAQLGRVRRGRAPEPKKKAGGAGKARGGGGAADMEFSMEEAIARQTTGGWMEFDEADVDREQAHLDYFSDEGILDTDAAIREELNTRRVDDALLSEEIHLREMERREESATAAEAAGYRIEMAQRGIALASRISADAVTLGIQAIINGGENMKAALWGILSQQMAVLSAKHAALAVGDFADAASAFASVFRAWQGPGLLISGGKHVAAAAGFGALAVGAGLAGKARGGGGASRAPSLGSGGMVYGGGPGGGPAQLDRGGGGPKEYHIVLKDGAETMFEVISDEDERRRRAGQSTLGQAA